MRSLDLGKNQVAVGGLAAVLDAGTQLDRLSFFGNRVGDRGFELRLGEAGKASARMWPSWKDQMFEGRPWAGDSGAPEPASTSMSPPGQVAVAVNMADLVQRLLAAQEVEHGEHRLTSLDLGGNNLTCVARVSAARIYSSAAVRHS